MRKIILSLLLAVALLYPVGFVLAADDPPPATGAAKVQLENPLGPNSVGKDGSVTVDKTDLPTLIGVVIKGILGIIGAVVLAMFIWGSQMWLTAAGNAEKIKTGWKTMIFAALGAFIVFFAYLLLNFVLTYLGTGCLPNDKACLAKVEQKK